MFWIGLIIGGIIGVVLGMIVSGILFSAKIADLIDEILNNKRKDNGKKQVSKRKKI